MVHNKLYNYTNKYPDDLPSIYTYYSVVFGLYTLLLVDGKVTSSLPLDLLSMLHYLQNARQPVPFTLFSFLRFTGRAASQLLLMFAPQ